MVIFRDLLSIVAMVALVVFGYFAAGWAVAGMVAAGLVLAWAELGGE